MPRNGFMRIIKKIHKNADYNNRVYYFNSLVFFLPYYSYLILSGEYLMNGVVPNILRLCLRFKKITVKKSLFFFYLFITVFFLGHVMFFGWNVYVFTTVEWDKIIWAIRTIMLLLLVLSEICNSSIGVELLSLFSLSYAHRVRYPCRSIPHIGSDIEVKNVFVQLFPGQ